MKKQYRVILSVAIISCIFFASMSLLMMNEAAAKTIPKLSSKSILLAKGGTQKITLKDGNGNWSIEGNDVIKIKKATKSYVTIAPIKAGNATVTCKTGGKKLYCKVKVLNNRIGDAEDDLGYSLLTGDSFSFSYMIPEDVSFENAEYDSKIGKVTVKTTLDKDTSETKIKVKIKALKPGRFILRMNYMSEDQALYEEASYVFINGFRGNKNVKKNEANYRKWRKKTISSMVSSGMSTWEIIDGIGTLISSGKYSNKGGATGIQLWFGGNGTCLSGAIMMNDFLKDLGIKSKVHFAGNDGGATDIYGATTMYSSGHRNVKVSIGGKKYTLNPQPGSAWPYGTIKK